MIPAYNAATWLTKSIPVLCDAISKSKIKEIEIIVVDDASTDGTASVVQSLDIPFKVKVISHKKNQGRFIARETGANAASYEAILFIDSRIMIGKGSLKYIVDNVDLESSDNRVWTSHVYINKDSIYARFWEAITYNAWWSYFYNPRRMRFGIKGFDKYPKGTTCFFVPRDIIREANRWFRGQTRDLRSSNDDTLLIRRIAAENMINIGPEFNCVYNARSNFKQYIKHVFNRGRFFVDGFLRNDGNGLLLPLVLFLVLSLAIPISIVLMPYIFLPCLLAGLLLWLAAPLIMVFRGTSILDALSFFILFPIFFLSYGAGIWRAVPSQVINKK